MRAGELSAMRQNNPTNRRASAPRFSRFLTALEPKVNISYQPADGVSIYLPGSNDLA
jgi:hypothetical protein